jgi:hypothetical protein
VIAEILVTIGAALLFVLFIAFIWGLLFGPSIFDRDDRS